MKKPKTYLHPFQDELVFYPNKKGKVCKFCGICSFAHKHKAGTLPKDFERIPERVADVGKTIKPLTGKGTCIAELQSAHNRLVDFVNELRKEVDKLKEDRWNDVRNSGH